MLLKDYAVYNTKGEDGLAGACLEVALHDILGEKLEVRAVGKTDLRLMIEGKLCKVEVKTGAGRLLHDCRGNSYMLYCPVVNLEADIYHQEAFLIRRKLFIQILQDVGLYRASKDSTSGPATEAIQTFWNRKLNKPHGRKYEKLLDRLYEESYGTIDVYLQEQGL